MKKLLATILALVMALGLCSVSWATDPAVAKVGGQEYATLEEAVDAATEKATVTLLADTRENVTISTNRLTLDLNGHTLNGGTVKGKPALTVTARYVTVKDSSEAQTGTIMREDTAETSGVSSHYVIDVQGKSLLTFESGTVKNNSGNTEGKRCVSGARRRRQRFCLAAVDYQGRYVYSGQLRGHQGRPRYALPE